MKEKTMTSKYTLRFKLQRSLGLRGQSFWPTRRLTEKQKFLLQTVSKKKLSTYGQEIVLKRLLSALYGKLSAKQMQTLWQKAQSGPGKPGENFLSALENRFETVIYRLNFFRSFREGRQAILHGGFCLNGHPVTQPNCALRPGDVIHVSGRHFPWIRARILKNWHEKACVRTKSLHLEMDLSSLSAIFLYTPQQILFPLEFEFRSLS